MSRPLAPVFRGPIVARLGRKEPPPSQLGGPGKTPLSAWFSAVPGGFGRASWSAQRCEFSACFCWARRRPCQGPARLAVLPRITKAVCGGGGSDQSQVNVASGNHAIPASSHRVGVTSDGAENPPRLRVTNGE